MPRGDAIARTDRPVPRIHRFRPRSGRRSVADRNGRGRRSPEVAAPVGRPETAEGLAGLGCLPCAAGNATRLWTDTLGVQTYDLDGNRVGGFQIKYAPPAVARDDVADAVAGFPTEMRSMFESVLGDSTPARWPAVRQFLIDDRDRLWFAISGDVREDTEWAAFSTEGVYLGSVLVPRGSTALLIRADGTLYAERVDEDDVPQVVMYRMVRPLR